MVGRSSEICLGSAGGKGEEGGADSDGLVGYKGRDREQM